MLLVATAGGGHALQVARAAAIGNALLLFVVLECGIFAWLQWTTTSMLLP